MHFSTDVLIVLGPLFAAAIAGLLQKRDDIHGDTGWKERDSLGGRQGTDQISICQPVGVGDGKRIC